ncbi:MAG: hypothetical protein KL840_21190 [Aquamicrobium sp.]|nr:hypothetical protein [Aquamicrobium sp.]
MSLRDDWEAPRAARGWSLGPAGMGALRVTLLFGSAAVALALILTPMLEDRTRKIAYSAYPAGVDMMPTGSIGQRSNPGAYTIRRSVLQPSPNAVCIIRGNGMRTGDC